MKSMKKLLCLLLTAVMLLSSVSALADTVASTDSATAKWTVLIYLCGTDLESNGKMATVNLTEISETLANENVNVVIETGGCSEWHAQDLGLDIASDRIQRYTYDANGFTLVEEGPLDNMAQSETLRDFVAWGAANYPAEHYALTVWDHGGGSKTGLILDEMHGNAVMSLEEFGRALDEAGVYIEDLILDTCLMATVETCAMVDDNVHYLVASQEVVPGKGSDYKSWVQFLFDNPDADGLALGKDVVDSVMEKYQKEGIDETVTFSVTDLTKMEPVYAAFDNMFVELGNLLSDVTSFNVFAVATNRSESYQDENMRDLADMATRGKGSGLSDEVANAVVNAVTDAVVYVRNGSSHQYSTGLSFYYAPTGSASDMDRYARQSFSNTYLAFLDATHMNWSAPASTYEKVSRLPDITYEDYTVEPVVSVSESGITMFCANGENAVSSVDGVLYYSGEDGVIRRLGATYDVGMDVTEDGSLSFYAKFDGKWPSINGVLCQMDIVEENANYTLYNVPVQVAGTDLNLRVGYVFEHSMVEMLENVAASLTETYSGSNKTEEELIEELMAIVNSTDVYAGTYEVYGLWNNGNTALEMPGRDVAPLRSIVGYPLEMMSAVYDLNANKETGTVSNGTVTVTEEGLTVEEMDLPDGTYAYMFAVKDALNREIDSELVFFELKDGVANFSEGFTESDLKAATAVMQGTAEYDTLTPVQQNIYEMLMAQMAAQMGTDASSMETVEGTEDLDSLGEMEVVTEDTTATDDAA
jgi:hypothetical protein